MYTYKPENVRLPIKVWMPDASRLEDGCADQAENLARLPFAFRHIALMPDTHQGFGMPVGGVLATEKVIIPNAVGVDIGCGMCFVQTNVQSGLLKEPTANGSILQTIIGQIMRNVPTGFAKHKKSQESAVLEQLGQIGNETALAIAEIEGSYGLKISNEIGNACHQVGTLGGGNHFIEIQEDDEGKVCLMVHSGSRHLGLIIANYFNKIAEQLNEKWASSVPTPWQLAFLPTDIAEGQGYISCMKLALDFAAENRERIMDAVETVFSDTLMDTVGAGFLVFGNRVNAHHNYAALENHFGKNVWIHRKGAISAKAGERGIVPGAMGSYSYITEGLGNPESFFSSSHGAGRLFSRTQAKKEITVQRVMEDLKAKGVVLGKNKKDDVAEECLWAYKDIEQVIANEQDLTKPVKRLQTLGVVKG